MQRQILTEALAGASALAEPGVLRLPLRWHNDEWRTDPLGWSRKREASQGVSSQSGDSRQSRTDQPKYQTEADQTAAESVSNDEQCLVCLGL